MAQRNSEYARVPEENYATVEDWPVLALASQLPINVAWDPAAGDGHLVAALHRAGIEAIGTTDDFLTMTAPPRTAIDAVITNPPYGPNRRGELAVAFIKHALAMPVRHVAMLLAVDFESAISRQHLFRHCPTFTGKLVLLNRIRWIAGSTGSPSVNHCWLMWDRTNVAPPTIRYMARSDVT